MVMNLSYFDAVLKDIYLGPIRDNLNNATILMNRINKTSEFVDASGRYIYTPLKRANNQGVGARGDRGALPTAGYNKISQSRTSIRHNYGRIEITGVTIRASKNDKGAFTKAVDLEVNGMVESLKKDINRQFICGDSYGPLATVDTVPSSVTLTVKNPGGMTTTKSPTMFIKEGMLLDVYTGTNATTASVSVTSVNESTGVITTSTHGATIGDVLYRQGSYGIEMMGLKGIIDDGTVVDTLQNIQSSTYTFWQSKRFHNSGTARDVTPAIMQDAYTACEKQGEPASLILVSFEIRDAYANSLVNMRRIVNTLQLDGGWEGLDYNGKPVTADVDCPAGSMFFVNEGQLCVNRVSDFAWGDEDGRILKYVPGYDSYEAFLYYDAELTTFRRNSHSVIYDLQ